MNRPRRASKKPTGPSITIAESVQMMQNIKADPGKRISREHGMQAVRDFFTRDELPIEYKQVSLVCPNSSKRIVDPVRGVNCTHLECFDLAAYLELQVKHPYWQCPRCQQRVEADELRIDEYTSYILRIELDNVGAVEVFADGAYRRIDPTPTFTVDLTVAIDDETGDASSEENDTTIEERMVAVPLKSLLDLNRQTKDLRRQLPEKKGNKRKSMTVDPAEMAETLHDSIRGIIKHATSSNLAAQLNSGSGHAVASTWPATVRPSVQTPHHPVARMAKGAAPSVNKTPRTQYAHCFAPKANATHAIKRPTPDKNAAPLVKQKRAENLPAPQTAPLDMRNFKNVVDQSSLDVRIFLADSLTRSELSLGGKSQLLKSFMELHAKNELNAHNLRMALSKIKMLERKECSSSSSDPSG